jgi:hypothetical protein
LGSYDDLPLKFSPELLKFWPEITFSQPGQFGHLVFIRLALCFCSFCNSKDQISPASEPTKPESGHQPSESDSENTVLTVLL